MQSGGRQAIPITDADLDKLVDRAERLLTHINGTKDLEQSFKNLTNSEGKSRTLPIDNDLLFSIRNGVCLYFWFSDWLFEKTGQKAEVESGVVASDSIKKKQTFSSAYALFVMGSFIVDECKEIIDYHLNSKGKDTSLLASATPNFNFDPSKSASINLQVILNYYVQTLESSDDKCNAIVRNAGDIVSVTRDFFQVVANKALVMAQGSEPSLTAVVNETFNHNDFVVHEFEIEKEQEHKSVSFVPVQPEEVVGNDEAILFLLRLADRLALYDPALMLNPMCEFGGVTESNLLDGPAGTGKTTLIKMMLTRLNKRCDQIELPFYSESLTAAEIKSEWYGKSGKLLADKLKAIMSPTQLAVMTIDDIDLLIGQRDSPGSGGADKDLLKGLMDFFAGVGANYKGNYTSLAATNKATGFDDALRQRFVYRVLVKGAESWEDQADLVALQLRKVSKEGLVCISDQGYTPLKRAKISTIFANNLQAHHKGLSYKDIGNLILELKGKDEHFTARSVKNAIDVTIAKSSDFDIPEEWFTKPELFRKLEYKQRLQMLKDMFHPITTDQIIAAIEEQFDSEQRYKTKKYVN